MMEVLERALVVNLVMTAARKLLGAYHNIHSQSASEMTLNDRGDAWPQAEGTNNNNTDQENPVGQPPGYFVAYITTPILIERSRRTTPMTPPAPTFGDPLVIPDYHAEDGEELGPLISHSAPVQHAAAGDVVHNHHHRDNNHNYDDFDPYIDDYTPLFQQTQRREPAEVDPYDDAFWVMAPDEVTPGLENAQNTYTYSAELAPTDGYDGEYDGDAPPVDYNGDAPLLEGDFAPGDVDALLRLLPIGVDIPIPLDGYFSDDGDGAL